MCSAAFVEIVYDRKSVLSVEEVLKYYGRIPYMIPNLMILLESVINF